MKRLFFYIGLVFIVSSCINSSDNSKKTITLDEVMGEDSTSHSKNVLSNTNYEDSTVKANVQLSPISKMIFDKLAIDSGSIEVLDTFLYVDRYESQSAEKMKIRFNGQTAYYYHWNFKKSSQATNAFLNWMQCYGKKCLVLPIGETKSVNSEKMLVVVTENDIFYLDKVTKNGYETILKTMDEASMKCVYSFYQNGKNGVTWLSLNSKTMDE